MTTRPGSLFTARDLSGLSEYAKAALDWSFVEEDSDLYYQRMFNLAGDVVRLTAEIERLREALRHIADMPDAISRPAWETQARWLKSVAFSALPENV